MYIKATIYLDLDSDLLVSLDKELKEDDMAVITREGHHTVFFDQWGLIYTQGHPFLKRTIEYILDNFNNRKVLHDVHALTGPTVYTLAIKDV